MAERVGRRTSATGGTSGKDSTPGKGTTSSTRASSTAAASTAAAKKASGRPTPAKGAKGARAAGSTTRRAGSGRRTTRALPEPGGRAVAIVLVLAILVFAIMLRGEHVLVTSAAGTEVAAIQVALFLSSILLAAQLLGAAAGLGAVRLLSGPDGARMVGAGGRRALLTLLGGLVAGIIGGCVAYLLESDLKSADALTLAVCIAVAGLVGGAIAALRPGAMIIAGLIGTLAALAVETVRSLFLTDLTRLFGGEQTVTRYAAAQSRLALVSSLLAGVLAGIAVHLVARRTGNRLGTAANMAAGGTAGGLALVAQLLTWVGAAKLVTSAGGLDLGDQLAFALSGRFQVIGAMALLFSGALVAVVLYGRTVPSRRRTAPAKPTTKPDWAIREERKAAEIDRARAAKKTADTRAADTQMADERAADDRPAVKQAVDKQAADDPPADKQAVDKQAVDKRAADKQAADNERADSELATEKRAGGRGVTGESATRRPTE